jgi:hypothetical protein
MTLKAFVAQASACCLGDQSVGTGADTQGAAL